MGYVLFYLVTIPLGIVWHGYADSVLWSWFIVPLGAPAIGLWHAGGIALFVTSLLGSRGLEMKAEDKRDKMEKAAAWSVVMFILPAFALLFGWLYKLGM